MHFWEAPIVTKGKDICSWAEQAIIQGPASQSQGVAGPEAGMCERHTFEHKKKCIKLHFIFGEIEKYIPYAMYFFKSQQKIKFRENETIFQKIF